MNGATRPHEAAPGSIRGDFALETAQNLVHASDSPETAEAELALWFAPRSSSATSARSTAGRSPRRIARAGPAARSEAGPSDDRGGLRAAPHPRCRALPMTLAAARSASARTAAARSSVAGGGGIRREGPPRPDRAAEPSEPPAAAIAAPARRGSGPAVTPASPGGRAIRARVRRGGARGGRLPHQRRRDSPAVDGRPLGGLVRGRDVARAPPGASRGGEARVPRTAPAPP